MTLQIIPDQVEPMSIPRSVFLHLFPGVLVVLFDILAAPIVVQMGFPLLLTLILADILILIPVELFVLLYINKKENDSFNLKKLIPYFEPLPLKKIIGLIVLTFVWAYLINMLLFPVAAFLSDNFFGWMPDVFFSTNPIVVQTTDFSQYSSINLSIVFILALLGIGIGIPIVEELYFRGYLMSRLSRFNIWASIISVSLWALYHFWAPWSIVTYILSFIPVAFVVQKYKNIYIAIVGHMIANVFLVISLAPILLV